jgi:hypothetical protein
MAHATWIIFFSLTVREGKSERTADKGNDILGLEYLNSWDSSIGAS